MIFSAFLRISYLSLLVILSLPGHADDFEDYQVIDVQERSVGAFTVSEALVQVGREPVNRFVMHRWIRTHAQPRRIHGVLLLQSGLGGNFRLFELDDDPSLKDSMAAFFARRNFAVYGYSPRASLIPAGACESGQVDCGPIQDWDLQSFLDDLAFIRARIGQDLPGKKVVIGGISLGAINTIAMINRFPEDFDGAIIWEGMLASDDPDVLSLNQGYCAFMENELAEGRFVDGQGLVFFKQVAALAGGDPEGISPFAPLFGLPPQTTNHQLFVFTLTEQAPGPATLPVPNYVLVNGDFQTDSFAFIDESRILQDIGNFSNYIPNRAVRDISCSLAGLETAYTDQLSQYSGKVLAIGGGRGFGAFMQDNLDLLTSADVEFLLTEDFAHVDHIFLPTPFHRLFVERPILRWLHRKVPR